jgi:hypothetical protein
VGWAARQLAGRVRCRWVDDAKTTPAEADSGVWGWGELKIKLGSVTRHFSFAPSTLASDRWHLPARRNSLLLKKERRPEEKDPRRGVNSPWLADERSATADRRSAPSKTFLLLPRGKAASQPVRHCVGHRAILLVIGHCSASLLRSAADFFSSRRRICF